MEVCITHGTQTKIVEQFKILFGSETQLPLVPANQNRHNTRVTLQAARSAHNY